MIPNTNHQILQSLLSSALTAVQSHAQDVVASADAPPYAALLGRLATINSSIRELSNIATGAKLTALAQDAIDALNCLEELAQHAALEDDDALSIADYLDLLTRSTAEALEALSTSADASATQLVDQAEAPASSEPQIEVEQIQVEQIEVEQIESGQTESGQAAQNELLDGRSQVPELVAPPSQPATVSSDFVGNAIVANTDEEPAEALDADTHFTPLPIELYETALAEVTSADPTPPKLQESIVDQPSASEAVQNDSQSHPVSELGNVSTTFEQTKSDDGAKRRQLDDAISALSAAVSSLRAPAVELPTSSSQPSFPSEALPQLQSIAPPTHPSDQNLDGMTHAVLDADAQTSDQSQSDFNAVPILINVSSALPPVEPETDLGAHDQPHQEPLAPDKASPTWVPMSDVLELDTFSGMANPTPWSPSAQANQPLTQDAPADEAQAPAQPPLEPPTVPELVFPQDLVQPGTSDQFAPQVPSFEAPTMIEGDAPELTAEQLAMLNGAEEQAGTWGTTPLSLSPEKASSLQFLVNDVRQCAELITAVVPQLPDLGVRDDVVSELLRLSEAMNKATAEFEFRCLRELIVLVGDIGAGLVGVTEEMLPEITIRLLSLQSLILQHAGALEVAMETTWPLQTLRARIHRMLSGKSLATCILAWHRNDVERCTELDKVVEGIDPPPVVEIADDTSDWHRPAASQVGGKNKAVTAIKVDPVAIEALLSMVGEMAQHQSSVQSHAEKLRLEFPSHTHMQHLSRHIELLERSLAGIQTSIMGMRTQPLSRLVDNYPRIVRDVARLADREVELTVHGGNTLVDASVLDGLAEPLIILLRYAASRLIESPADRQKANKPAAGSMSITVRNQGSQIVISVQDDGGGFDRTEIASQILAAGVLSAEELDDNSDDQLATLLLEGRVTSSPLSKVGPMLQTNLGATFTIRTESGRGSQIDLIIPMTSAILPSVLVAVGASCYTVPLQSVVEITRIEPSMLSSVIGGTCLRLRNEVYALVDARDTLGDRVDASKPAFALIVTTGESKAALGVDRVISKRDVLIRHIEDAALRRGPFSGATLTREGTVSLVLDVQRLLSIRPAAVPAHAA